MTGQDYRLISPDQVTPHPANPRRGNLPAIVESVRNHGLYGAVVVQASTGHVIVGNHRVLAARELGLAEIPAAFLDVDDDEALRILANDNRTSDLGGYDNQSLTALLTALAATETGYDGTGYNNDDLTALTAPPPGPDEQARLTLAERFGIPPFDVLDARSGWWQARKAAWLAHGIRSELGRSARAYNTEGMLQDDRFRRAAGPHPGGGGGGAWLSHTADGTQPHDRRYSRDEEQGLLLHTASGRDPTYYAQKTAAESQVGHALTAEQFEAGHYQPSAQYESGTSTFDPVLCELAYRWFSPPAGAVLDPLAGGSVRGVVAGLLGRTYTGCDLSAPQIDANRLQAAAIIPDADVTWTVADAATWTTEALTADSHDLLFTCPPYLWLEKYGDLPGELSAMTVDAYTRAWQTILTGCTRALRDHSYAVIVVGDVRDKDGGLIDLRGLTITAAQQAGLTYQSGAVLVTPVGSLAVRAPHQFQATRVLGRTHQDVLIFYKGDRQQAAARCGPVEYGDLPEQYQEAAT